MRNRRLASPNAGHFDASQSAKESRPTISISNTVSTKSRYKKKTALYITSCFDQLECVRFAFDGVTKGLAIRHFPSVGCFIENAVNPHRSRSAFHVAKILLFHKPARGCCFFGQKHLSDHQINHHCQCQTKPHAQPDNLALLLVQFGGHPLHLALHVGHLFHASLYGFSILCPQADAPFH